MDLTTVLSGLSVPVGANRSSAKNSGGHPIGSTFSLAAPIARAPVQQTLAKQIKFVGPGLHSGLVSELRLVPAIAGHGIRFLRTDLFNGARLIVPSALGVSQTQLCTLLSNGDGGEVSTVEHLMAALHATGLSNALIEINGPEVPILDGSSAPFVDAILSAGLMPQDAPKSYLRVKRLVHVGDGNKAVTLSPQEDPLSRDLDLDFTIDFTAACIGRQSFDIRLSLETFCAEVGQARTFGFAEHINALRSRGLARGGSLNNAIIIENEAVKNPEGLRFADEFVRHKLLDAVGDLFIEGLPVIGRYRGVRAGHDITNRAMRILMADPENFEIVQF